MVLLPAKEWESPCNETGLSAAFGVYYPYYGHPCPFVLI